MALAVCLRRIRLDMQILRALVDLDAEPRGDRRRRSLASPDEGQQSPSLTGDLGPGLWNTFVDPIGIV
jgi:hypothetical protein